MRWAGDGRHKAVPAWALPAGRPITPELIAGCAYSTRAKGSFHSQTPVRTVTIRHTPRLFSSSTPRLSPETSMLEQPPSAPTNKKLSKKLGERSEWGKVSIQTASGRPRWRLKLMAWRSYMFVSLCASIRSDTVNRNVISFRHIIHIYLITQPFITVNTMKKQVPEEHNTAHPDGTAADPVYFAYIFADKNLHKG